MYYPKLKEIKTSREIIEKFGGYSHTPHTKEAEFYDMKNLSSDNFPFVSPRKQRGTYITTSQPGGMISKAEFCYVDGKYFYIGENKYNLKLTAGNKSLVSMGANVIVLPDQKYINTVNPDQRGNIENGVYDIPEATQNELLTPKLKFTFVGYNEQNKKYYTFNDVSSGRTVYVNKTPRNPVQYDIRIDSTGLSQYNGSSWVNKEAYCIAIYTEDANDSTFEINLQDISKDLKDVEKVYKSGVPGIDNPHYTYPRYGKPLKISGFGNKADELENVLVACDDDGNITTKIIDVESSETATERNALILLFQASAASYEDKSYLVDPMQWVTDEEVSIFSPYTLTTSMSIVAKSDTTPNIPTMDFVIESGNRLWGCRYGLNKNGDFVNEIYASALGDFGNWIKEDNTATDAYTVPVGTDGAFTGAINYGGMPIFFKENCIHKIYGDYPSNYRVQTNICRGVQNGCSKSLAIVNELLFYKSRSGVCVYDGSSSVDISEDLGDISYSEAVGGALGNKYYISMKAPDNEHYIFVYDTLKRMWHKEDNVEVVQFCNHKGDLFYIDRADNFIKRVNGAGEQADPVQWSAITGIHALSSPDNKYVSRIDIRMSIKYGASVSFFIEYDSNGEWQRLFTSVGNNLQSFTIPIKPRRCDHFRLRMDGIGEAKIYSICKTMEGGSEVR